MTLPDPYKWPAIVVCLAFAGVSTCALFSGCVDGPLAKYGGLNPWVKKQWEQEDAEYGPSFETRVARLRSIRSRAKNLDESERERISRDLAAQAPSEPNLAVRREMVLTLGQLPTETATVALRHALTDSEPEMRVAACEAWRRRGGGEAVERLSGVVGNDTNTDVRLAATRALGRFRDPAAVRGLASAIDDNNPALQYEAIQSLRSASGRDFGGDVAAWRNYAKGQEPEAASEASMAERFFKWK